MSQSAARLNLSAGVASVVVAVVLVMLKVWALAETNAISVAATLADSAMDLLVSAAGLAAIAYAARPPDQDHAFGHGSAEDLAALGQSVFLSGAAFGLAVVSLRRLLSDAPPLLRAEGLGMSVMVMSILLTVILVVWQRYVARRTGNRVVAADSLHYITDLIPNLGAIAALWVSARYGLTSVDSVVGLLAALALGWGALRIGRGAWNALMDRMAEPEFVRQVAKIIDAYPGVEGFHDMRTRTAGSRVFVDFHIDVDGRLSLQEAHDICAGLKRAILAKHPTADVLIHMDPVIPGGPRLDGTE